MCLPTLHNLPLDKWKRNYARFPATGRSLYVAGCGFSLIEEGSSDLPGDKDFGHTCAQSPGGGGNPPARHSSIPQTFPVLTAIIRCNRRCGRYSPGNKWIRSRAWDRAASPDHEVLDWGYHAPVNYGHNGLVNPQSFLRFLICICSDYALCGPTLAFLLCQEPFSCSFIVDLCQERCTADHRLTPAAANL